MLCEKCGKNEATLYYSETVNGKKRSIALCSECAPTENHIGGFKDAIFSGIFGEPLFGRRTPDTKEIKKCPVCGMTLSMIARSGKVGCSECYTVFRDELAPSIRRIHGGRIFRGENIQEKSEQSSNPAPALSKEDELRMKLKAAIEEENYELAATLRDEIRAITSLANEEK